MPINPIAAGSPMTRQVQASKELGKNDFLKLLIAQLQYQDPLEPKADTEFVAQLAQFSSLEQLVDIGGSIDGLAMAQAASNSSDIVGFIGKEILAISDQVALGDDGLVELGWDLPGRAATVTVEIRTPSGRTVRTIEVDQASAGRGSVDWDGLDDEGRPLPPGTYHFEVIALDGDGRTMPVEPLVVGRVTGVTFESGYPELRLGENKVSLNSVREVNE